MSAGRSRTALLIALLCLGAAQAGKLAAQETATPPEAGAAGNVLEGAWQAREYQLASGESHAVRGRIFFTRDEWQVLFFVMEGSDPRRGSGEGGRYTLAGDELTLEHLFHLSAGEAMPGLPASPLTLTARDDEGSLEPTHFEVRGGELTLRFPSGNAMTFSRSPRDGSPPDGK